MKYARNYALDFYKFIFAILVLLYHANSMTNNADEMLMVNGRIGVEFFFLVSGCMMAMSAERRAEGNIAKDTLSYLKSRYFSLMPNVVVAFIISFVVFHVNFRISSLRLIASNFISTLPDLLLIKQTGIKAISYNGVTWYLSTMLLVMSIVYPLLKKFKDLFLTCIAPVSFLLILGYLFQKYDSLSNLEEWKGFTFNASLRGLADILGGVVCYSVVKYIRKFKFTTTMRIFFSIVEYLCFALSICLMYSIKPSRIDYFILALFMIGIIIVVSEVSMDKYVFRHKIFGWLGTYSFSLYLGHSYWRKYVSNIYPADWNFYDRLVAYILISFVTGLFIMYVSKAIRSWWKTFRPKLIPHIIVVEN